MIKIPLITSPRATDTTKAALCLFYAFFNLRKLLYIIVFEIKRPDSAIQKIHFDIPHYTKNRIRNRHFSLRLIRLLFLLNNAPSERTESVIASSIPQINKLSSIVDDNQRHSLIGKRTNRPAPLNVQIRIAN